MTNDEIWERVGGKAFFVRLVDEFYAGVVGDAVLWPLYPDPNDLEGAKQRLALFLAHYWGGEPEYMELRGHPKLRLRHMGFVVGPLERDRWLVHMAAAVELVLAATANDDDEVRTTLMEYFTRAAEHLRNDTGLPISSPRS